MDTHRLQLDNFEAVVARQGGELQALSLRGMALLWTGGPLWPRHAPLLFPVVGGLNGNLLHHRGAAFPMPKHGFARDHTFTWLERTPTTCVLELREDENTRDCYPFSFRLTIAYALGTSGLRIELDLQNPSDEPLPASLGLHPAFRWPLAPSLAKSSHRLVFEAAEPGPVHRLDSRGLLAAEPNPTPIVNRTLALNEALFREDALIFVHPHSRSLRFEAEGGPSLSLSWEGFPQLGLWAKPDLGPSFLCIEPWNGYADPVDWVGEFSTKPGGFLLAPGTTRHWSFTIALSPDT